MSQAFKFSDPGEGLQEAEILDVHVGADDTVTDGDTVLTVETDKTSMDIPAPFDGTIDEVKVSEGDTVQVGDVLLTYSREGESDGDSGEQSETRSSEGSGEDSNANVDDASETQNDRQEDRDEAASQSEWDQGQDQHQDRGQSQDEKNGQSTGGGEDAETRSDSGGRSQGKSRTQFESGSEDASQKPNKQAPDSDTQSGSGESEAQQDADANRSGSEASSTDPPVPAAPSTRRLAREQGVDLHEVEASGPKGRVTDADVRAYASGSSSSPSRSQFPSQGQPRSAGETSPLTPGLPPPKLPDFTQWGDTERMPLRSIRRATARNMARSWSQIPHVYHQDVADITALEGFAREHPGQHGKLTVTVLVMKALAGLMQRYPRFNASLDVENQEIVLKRYCHIGLAVATERGLLVPVIRDVDRKPVLALADEVVELAVRARDGDLDRSEVQGGTITITNVGPLGGTSLTPLIDPPQAAIVGLARARLEPVAMGDADNFEIVARRRLPLVLGFDHRINDGADAARFMTELVDSLADPQSLLLAV